MKTFSLFIISILVFAACTKVIDFDLKDSEPRLIIEALITDKPEPQIVKLSLSGKFYGANTTPPAEGATVTLFDGFNTISLSETKPGIYTTPNTFQAITGRTYYLTVNYDNKEYTASAKMNPSIPFDTIKIDYGFSFIRNEVDTTRRAILFTGQEPPTKGNVYMWWYYINGKLETDTLREAFVNDDSFVNGTYFNDFSFFEFDKSLVKTGDTVKVEMFSINKGYQDFHFALLTETDFRGFLFDGPPANVQTNITGGAFGWFECAGVSSKITIVPPL
jgi:hypothetical protein